MDHKPTAQLSTRLPETQNQHRLRLAGLRVLEAREEQWHGRHSSPHPHLNSQWILQKKTNKMFKYNFCNMVTSFLGKILRVGLTEPRIGLTIKAVRKLLHPTKTPIEQCCPTITVLLNGRLLLCLTQRPLMHMLASKHWISPTAEEVQKRKYILSQNCFKLVFTTAFLSTKRQKQRVASTL